VGGVATVGAELVDAGAGVGAIGVVETVDDDREDGGGGSAGGGEAGRPAKSSFAVGDLD